MKKILKLALFILFLGTFNFITVHALSTRITTSSTKITPNSEFKLSLVVSGLNNGLASAEYTISYDSSKVTYVSSQIGQSKPSGDLTANSINGQVILSYIDNNGGTNSFTNGTIITIRFKSKSNATSGSATFKLTGSQYGDKDANPLTGTTSNLTVNFYKPSSEAKLKTLTVSNMDLNPKFSTNTKSYTLPETDLGEITISATASTGATISGIGKRSLNYGANTLTITVTAEDKVTKNSYVIKINRKDTRSSENRLQSLIIEDYEIDFSSDKYTYEIELPEDITTLNIKATSMDQNAKITGIGIVNITPSQLSHSINVTAENGDIKMYSIIFTNRGTISTNPSANLLKLIINNININLGEESTYLFGVTNDTTKLDIKYETESPTATVEIKNNNSLANGINRVIISVKDGELSKEYYIIVNKDYTTNKVTSIESITNSNLSQDLIIEITEPSITIPYDILKALKASNAKLYLNYVDGYKGLLYAVSVPSIIEITGDITFNLSLTNQDPYTISSTIPTGIEIKYYLDNFNLSNEQLFGYNSKDNSQVLITENPDINNGYITFISNGSESYILSNDAINSNQSTSTTLPNIIYIGIGIVIGILGTLAAQWFIKNKDKIIPKKKQSQLKSVITPVEEPNQNKINESTIKLTTNNVNLSAPTPNVNSTNQVETESLIVEMDNNKEPNSNIQS